MISESFLEKYRPKTRYEVVGNNLIKERIFKQVDKNILNNMIFYGSSGTGKTSLAEIIAKELLKENFYTNCKIFNCSDKTGIDNIRENIISVCDYVPVSGLRIFIMEESEVLSKPAQKALKKPLESEYAKYNKFIFPTNDKSNFIPAIKDRCRIYDFMPIKVEDMLPRLTYIVEQEKIDIGEDMVERLAEVSNGSMRYPILQLEEFKALGRKITENDIKMEEGLETIKDIFLLLEQRKIPNAKNKVLDLYEKGNTFFDLMNHFHDFTMIGLNKETNFKIKATALIKIAEAERNVKEGCNEFIQISSLLSNISLLLNEKNKMKK